MKNFLIGLTVLASSISFAGAATCTFEQIQILSRAEGPQSEQVRALLMQETPNFSCKVTQEHLMFPADCGRFTYVKYTFDVKVGASRINALVQDGEISCTDTQITKLAKVKIK